MCGRRSRTAWAFGLAQNGVLSVVGLFALPALDRFGMPWPLSVMVMTVMVSVVIGLSTLSDEFRGLDLPPGPD